MTRDEYFVQDILTRLDQARQALETAETDPLVFWDDGIGLTVSDVLNDAYIAIKRLRSVPARGAQPRKRHRDTALQDA
jgi:hypothetical protein